MVARNTWIVIAIVIVLLLIFANNRQNILDEFSNYGPEYSTNNPEGAPWDISSPFYRSFWGYDRFYGPRGYYW
jgi:hypothetical protein